MDKFRKKLDKVNRKLVKIKDSKKYKSNKFIKEIMKRANLIQNKNQLINEINCRHCFLFIILLSIKLIYLYCKYNKEKFLVKSSNVTLKIKAEENVTILSDDFFNRYNPCEIYINNSLSDDILNRYNFNDSENISIIIKWNNTIYDAESMFRDCEKIIEIDLSHFDTSQVTNMSRMFYNCTSLISLDLTNLETSNVEDMNRLFVRCSLLSSLDLSNFNTSQVKYMYSMFHECSGLKTLNISSFDTSQVTFMFRMFYNCNSLNSLYLSNFVTSKVTNMEQMFYNCSSLTLLNLSNFDTSKVTTMKDMFYSCTKLASIDLTNSNTSNVQIMSNMFGMCTLLKELNLSSFDTSRVTTMFRMFSYCSNLILLNLNNFVTSKVDNMLMMFINCSSLKFLDLSNFDTKKITDMNGMFAYCNSLNSLNLSNFDTSNVKNLSFLFFDCSNLSLLDISNFNTSNVADMNHMFGRCNSLNSLNLSNFVAANAIKINNMFYNCFSLKSLDLSNFNISQAYNMDNMFYNCINLTFLNLLNFDITNSSHIKMFYNCSSLRLLNISHFNILNINSLTKILNESYNSEYIFFSISNLNITIDIFLLAYPYMIICQKNDDEIFDDSYLLTEKFIFCNNYKNYNNTQYNYTCYMKNISAYDKICNICGNNFFIDNKEAKNINNKSFVNCIDEEITNEFELSYLIFPSDLNYSNYLNYQNISNDSTNSIYIKDSNHSYNTNTLNYLNNSIESMIFLSTYYIFEKENITEIIKNIIDDLINGFDMTELDSGEDEIIIDKDKKIILTSTENQKINEDKNNITMNLGQCENILKNDYNISNNNSLYILQIISEEEGMKIPKVEYEVYYPLNGNNLTKLNLTSCKDTKIEISIKVKINDSLDKYNLKSDYYNDICSTTTTESGTDISLKDRKNEFIDNNMSLCEENCDLIEYNHIKEKAKCSCDIKLNIPENYDIKFNKNDFLKSFIDVKNMFNLKIINCYKTVFKIKSLMENYGFFICSPIIILYFLTLFIFSIYSYDKIKKEILNIIYALKINANPIKKNKIIKTKNINKLNNKMKKKKKNIKKAIKNHKNGVIEFKFNYIKQVTQNISGNSLANINQVNNYMIKKNNKKMNNVNYILQKKDFELNSLNYIEAIKLDHRNYCEYYISLIKYNHPIMFSFFPFDDYNIKIIKLFLFFISFCSDFAINALFFNDDTMHKIYKDKGKFDLLYQIPQILYSTLISKIIDTFLRSLALSQENIIELKQLKEKKNLKRI